MGLVTFLSCAREEPGRAPQEVKQEPLPVARPAQDARAQPAFDAADLTIEASEADAAPKSPLSPVNASDQSPAKKPGSTSNLSCEEIETKMARIAAKASSCRKDEECVKYRMFSYEYCYVYLNKTHKLFRKFQSLLDRRAQKERCPHVKRRCKKVVPACVAGKCSFQR
jgi:hypothetical protein